MIDEDYIPKEISNYSKYRKRDDVARPGRLHRGEKNYRNGKTHRGKGKTLRSHRR